MKTKKIEFDLKRWQSGDFVGVETRDGEEVSQLVCFNGVKDDLKICGVKNGTVCGYQIDGSYYGGIHDERDLMLIVKDDDEKVLELVEDLWIYTLAKKFIEQYERENK